MHKDFREKLEKIHKWPAIYMFKFIVPVAEKEKLESILKDHDLEFKESDKGNYISVTSKKMINSSDEVIQIYEEAHQIEGLIAL